MATNQRSLFGRLFVTGLHSNPHQELRFVDPQYPSSHRVRSMFPTNGGNYIVGYIHFGVDQTSTILRALKSPQQSVQDILKSFRHKINPRHGRMRVIDHLNKPVYLHPDAPQGTHGGPGHTHLTTRLIPSLLIGPTKKLLGEQLEEMTATVKKSDIDEEKD